MDELQRQQRTEQGCNEDRFPGFQANPSRNAFRDVKCQEDTRVCLAMAKPTKILPRQGGDLTDGEQNMAVSRYVHVKMR